MGRERDYYFDNLKFILIFLVVFGHLVGITRTETQLEKSIYFFIYLFHMPAFIIVSGYFSKNIKNTGSRVLTFVLIYLQFQIIHYIFQNLILGNDKKFSLIVPYYSLWYLLSLATWTFLLPHLLKVKHILIISTIISIFIFYDKSIGTLFSFGRTIVFLPFFLFGFYLNKKTILQLKSNKIIKYSSFVFFVLSIAFVFIYYGILDPRWVYGCFSYTSMDVDLVFAPVFRVILYTWSFLLCICIFIFTPDKFTPFSVIGKKSINIYLIHAPIVNILGSIKAIDNIYFLYRIPLYFLISWIIIFICSRSFADNILKPLTKPKLNILEKKLLRNSEKITSQ